MFCQFVAKGTGCKCDRCGRVVRKHNGAGLIAECPPACAHLGAPVRPIKAECQTCQGERLIEVAAATCAVFTRCLPTYAPAKPAEWNAREEAAIYHLCRGCERFTPATPAE